MAAGFYLNQPHARMAFIRSTSDATEHLSLSCHDLLGWVNDTLHTSYSKIEELCTGMPQHIPLLYVYLKYYTIHIIYLFTLLILLLYYIYIFF